MDGMHNLESLAEAARRETPPPIDVSERVIRSLRAREQRPQESLFSGPLFKFGAISFASAVVVGAVALDSWLTLHDPMVRLFDTVAMVMK